MQGEENKKKYYADLISCNKSVYALGWELCIEPAFLVYYSRDFFQKNFDLKIKVLGNIALHVFLKGNKNIFEKSETSIDSMK